MRLLLNPLLDESLSPVAAPGDAPRAFHQRLPGYAVTPLVDAPALASTLGIARLWIKDESSRLGLPAFKMLGASWAVYRVLSARLGAEPAPWATVDELAARFAPLRPLTLVAATDGNHGRAVARMARLLGFGARIFVPHDMVPARFEALQSEGADVFRVAGTYDDAVARSAEAAGERSLVISDTSWPGYEEVPRWVIEGYSTILREIDEQLLARDERFPTVIAVQMGVGALGAAVVAHVRSARADPRPSLIGVEPEHAACVLAAVEAGEIITLPGPQDSIMAGLNCGTASPVAWPLLSRGIDAFVAIEDEWARRAMRDLAAAGVVAGETGAAGLAGLTALLTDPLALAVRARLAITSETHALVICTEGATNPLAYRRIVGAAPQ